MDLERAERPVGVRLAFFQQALAFDPPANAFGFTVSNGGAGVIGQ